jgi:hypothetical protein
MMILMMMLMLIMIYHLHTNQRTCIELSLLKLKFKLKFKLKLNLILKCEAVKFRENTSHKSYKSVIFKFPILTINYFIRVLISKHNAFPILYLFRI